jgi:ubiquinone/menaquinone biosynthesis C-methylase UbiE
MESKILINRLLSRSVGYELRRAAPQRWRSASAPGSRRATMFFDAFPRFYSTSETTPYRGRLNLRYEAIFTENKDVLEGARVLDIASHDGRWSLAAIKSGAAHVLGVEGKESLVAAAEANFQHYGVDRSRYEFVAQDIFTFLARERPPVDVVLCLGFLYHTLRYNELLSHIRAMNPTALIIDTSITPAGAFPIIHVRVEPVAVEANAVADAYSHGDQVLSGRPSLDGLALMLAAYDFRVERLSDWGGWLRDNPSLTGVRAYQNGVRITARCRSVAD